MAWPELLNNAGITPSVVVFFGISIVVLIYLFFFQQNITALFYKLLMRCFLPQGISVKFDRFTFSIFTGQLSIHRVQVITQDMEINVGRIYATLFYWRKIPTYINQEGESRKCRLHMTINALDIVIYNRSWTTDMVLEINNMYREGKTTQEITNYLKSKWPDPMPYSLSLVYRAILPFEFDILAASFTVGNERLPAFCKLKANKINGSYLFKSRETPESHLKSKLEVNFENVSFQVHPHAIQTPPIFATSMRDIFVRSKEVQNVLNCPSLSFVMLSDMVGCYVNSKDSSELGRVNADPQYIINVSIGGENAEIEYGPYTDKLRRAFMTFFTPFYFNNPMIREDNKQKCKYMDVNIKFPDSVKISLPFVTNYLTHEKLIIKVGKETELIVKAPQNPTSYSENAMKVIGNFDNPVFYTSLGDEPIITAKSLKLDFAQIYPEVWNELTKMNVHLAFTEAVLELHPYHIDFLTQLGTDWSSWYPYQTVPDTAHNFFPYLYSISLEMEPVTISLLLDNTPDFSQFKEFHKHPHVDLKFKKMMLKVSMPFTEYKPAYKDVTVSTLMLDGTMEFVFPENHHFMERKLNKTNNKVSMDSLALSCVYKWPGKEGGIYNLPLNVKIDNAGGTATIQLINDVLTVIQNYTVNEKMVPESMMKAKAAYVPPINNSIMTTSFNIYIDYSVLQIPYDLYDTSNFVIAKLSELHIDVDGAYPFWSTLINIKSGTLEIPPTGYEYELFYKENIGSEEMKDASGIIHVDGIDITLRSISSKPGLVTSSAIAMEIGKVSGFALLPQLISALEITNNLMYEWFNEDAIKKPIFNKWYFYMLRTIKVLVGEVTICVDMGYLDLLPILLPSGVAVYMDNLINEDGHSRFHILIPVIDVAHLIQNSPEETFYPTMRLTTCLNIERNLKFDGGAEDSLKQAEYLRFYDKEMKQYDFLWGEIPNLPDSFYQNVEVYDPSAYQSSLDEEFVYYQEMATNPDYDNMYTLGVPAFDYETKKKFASPQKLAQWLHHYAVLRHYTHNFSSFQAGTTFSEDDPTTATEEDRIRFSKAYNSMNFVVPNQLIINVMPLSIPVFAALSFMMGKKPDSQLLSCIARETTYSYVAPANNKEVMKGVIAPLIKINVITDEYTLSATLKNLKIVAAKIFEPISNQTTITIDETKITYNLNEEEGHESVITTIPNIAFVSTLNRTVIKINPIDIKLDQDTPQLIADLAFSLKDELTNFPTMQGRTVKDFEEFIKSQRQYKEEKERVTNSYYVIKDAYIPQEYTAEVTALYAAYFKLGIYNFMSNFRNVSKSGNGDPEKKTTIFLSPISVNFDHPSGKTRLEVEPYNATISSFGDSTRISAGIKSFKLQTNPTILLFLDSLKQDYPDSEDTIENSSVEEPPKKLPSTKKLYFHIVANNMRVEFSQLVVDLEHVSCVASKNPQLNSIKKFSITTTIRGLSVNLSSYFSAKFAELSLCQGSESLKGALKIAPINITFPIEFALNPTEILQEVLDMDFSKLAKSSNKRDSDVSKDFEEKSFTKDDDNDYLINDKEEVSLTVLVEPIDISVVLNKYSNVSFQLPGVSGLVLSNNYILDFFTFVHQPIISLTNVMQFPIAHILLRVSVDFHKKNIQAFVMLGDVLATCESVKLSMAMGLLNEILGKANKLAANKKMEKEAARAALEEKRMLLRDASINVLNKEDKEGFLTTVMFLMPQINIEIPEIKSHIDIEAIFFILDLGSKLKFKAEIREIELELYEATLKTKIYTSYIDNTLNFSITQPSVVLNQTLFANISKLKAFAKTISHGMKKQKHVKKMLKSINQTVKTSIEKAQSQIKKMLSISSTQTLKDESESGKPSVAKEEKDPPLPIKVQSEYYIGITDASINIQLPHGGECAICIPIISLIMQTRKSDLHDKKATAAIFSIEKVFVQLDSAESSTTGTSSDAFESNIRGGAQDEYDNLSDIHLNKISLSAILFNKKVNVDSEVSGLKIRLYPTFPIAFASILEAFKQEVPTASESESEVDDEEDENEFANMEIKEEDEDEIDDKLEVEANFKCIQTDIELSPIDNTLPIPNITFTTLVKDNHAHAILDIKNEVIATLSPLIIEWIAKLNKNLKTFKANSPPAIQQEVPQIISPRAKAAKEKIKEEVIQKIKQPAKFTFDAVVNTSTFKVELNCAPRRPDVKIICKLVGVNAIHTPSATNARIIGFNISTHGQSNLATPYAKQKRLFELDIPSIDASIRKKDIALCIGNIFFKVSSEKVEDVVIFNDIWVVPFFKVFSKGEEETITPIASPTFNSQTPREWAERGNQRFVPSPKMPHRLPPPIPSQKTKAKAKVEEKVEKEEETSAKIKILLGNLDIQFMYGTGTGSLILSMYPIRVELGKDLNLFTVGATKLKSTGQLIGFISLDNVYAIQSKVDNKSSGLRGIVAHTLVDLKKADDPFIWLSVSNVSFSSNTQPKGSEPYTSILLSLDSPVLKATGNVVQNLLNFYKAIMDPIKIGLSRANRSYSFSDLLPAQNATLKAEEVIEKIIPNGKLIFLLSNTTAELHKYFLVDNEAIKLIINGAYLSLNVSKGSEGKVNRDLKFQLLPIALLKLIDSSKGTSRDILKIPQFKGKLNTVQDIVKNLKAEVLYDFVTDFNGLIEPTLNFQDYQYLHKFFEFLMKKTGDFDQDSDALLDPTSPKKNKKIEYNFTPNNYQFNPGFKVGIGAELKPNISWLLSQLGIDDEHIIPSSLFEGVSLGLEKILAIVSSSIK